MAASKGLVLELGSEEPDLQDPAVLAGHPTPQPQTQGVSGGPVGVLQSWELTPMM